MLYFIQLILNTVLSFRKKDVKVVSLLGILVLAYYTGTMSPLASYDTFNYAQYYSELKDHGKISLIFEHGYKLLNEIGIHTGLSYADFRIVTSIMFFLILYWVLLRFKVHTNIFVALYSIFPFFSEATQVRNFFMTTLVLLALTFIAKKTKKDNIIGLLIILLASQFHSFGYFYLLIFPLMLVTDDIILKINKVLPIVSVVVTVILILGKKYASAFILFVLGGERGKAYSEIWINYWVVMAIVLINVFLTIIVILINRYYQNNYVRVLSRLFLLTSLTTPIICISAAGFSRILRLEIIVGILLISMVCYLKKDIINLKIKSLLPIVFVIVLALISLDGGTLNIKHHKFGTSMGSYVPYILHYKKVKEE